MIRFRTSAAVSLLSWLILIVIANSIAVERWKGELESRHKDDGQHDVSNLFPFRRLAKGKGGKGGKKASKSSSRSNSKKWKHSSSTTSTTDSSRESTSREELDNTSSQFGSGRATGFYQTDTTTQQNNPFLIPPTRVNEGMSFPMERNKYGFSRG